MTHEYSDWATSTPSEDYVDGYFDIRPTLPVAPQLGFWTGFPRLSATVPRHLSNDMRIAVWCVISLFFIAFCGVPSLLLAMAMYSPLMRGWTW